MTHQSLPPFAAVSGSRTPRMVLIGEAWGESEAKLRRPFVGYSGQELFRMLGEAMPTVEPELHAEICDLFKYDLAWTRDRDRWLEAAGVMLTNVLAFRPLGNKLETCCGTKAEVGGAVYTLPPITKGKYLQPQYLPEVTRLYSELAACRPNLVVALGNTACWALLRATNIGSIRGAVTTASIQDPDSSLSITLKTLPTYHPAGVMRQWAWRPIVVADLMKAHREAGFPEVRRPARQVLVNPTLSEIELFVNSFLARWAIDHQLMLSADIETGAGQIKCISFAYSKDNAICVPFVDLSRPDGSYWPTSGEELLVWQQVKRLLECPATKLGQNFIYDLQYILKTGIRPANCTEDTMLLHHALYPEMQKGLGFLGSIYTNEASWKLMNRPKADTEKRDE